MNKTVEHYMNLSYTIELQRDPEEGWFVRVRELPGCMSQGDTAEEALKMIQDAMRAWLEVAIEDGVPIPEPRSDEAYSGKFVVRVPRSMHRALAEAAARDGVSLNQYINVALAQRVGRLHAVRELPDMSDLLSLRSMLERLLHRTGLARAPTAVHEGSAHYQAGPGNEDASTPQGPEADQAGNAPSQPETNAHATTPH